MVFVRVLALVFTALHVIDAGTKINDQYYLLQKLLPDVKEFSEISSRSNNVHDSAF